MLSFPAPSMEDGGGLPRGPVLALVFFPPPARAAAGPPEPRLAVARLFPVTVAAGGAGATWPLAFGPVCRGAAKMGRRRLGFPPAAAVELTGGGRPPPEEPVEKGGVGGGAGVDVHGEEIAGGGRGRRGRSRARGFFSSVSVRAREGKWKGTGRAALSSDANIHHRFGLPNQSPKIFRNYWAQERDWASAGDAFFWPVP